MNPTAATDAAQQTPDFVNGSSPHRVPQHDVHVDLLGRLDADLLHPARLAGPHAWHPWGLTRRPPTDDSVRFVVPTGPNAAAQIERITASLHDQLTSPTWPPAPPLDVTRHGDTLSCHGSGMTVAEVHVSAVVRERAGSMRPVTDQRDGDGWPILDEHAALSDRLDAIDPERTAADDIADLAHWVTHQMQARTPTTGREGLHALLRTHRKLAPRSTDRLATILARANQSGITPSALSYLEAVLNRTERCHADNNGRQRPIVANR